MDFIQIIIHIPQGHAEKGMFAFLILGMNGLHVMIYHWVRCHATIDSRYIAAIYDTIKPTEQKFQRYNFGQTMHSQATPHIMPSRASFHEIFKEIGQWFNETVFKLWLEECLTLKGKPHWMLY